MTKSFCFTLFDGWVRTAVMAAMIATVAFTPDASAQAQENIGKADSTGIGTMPGEFVPKSEYVPYATAYRCGDVTTPYANPYPCCDNNRNGSFTDVKVPGGDGNCTWYAWHKAREAKWVVPSTWGNAGNWCAKAASTAGWNLSSAVTAGSIACNAKIGHVAWVRRAIYDSSGRLTSFEVEEQNCAVAPAYYASSRRIKTYTYSTDWKFIRCVGTSCYAK